MAEAIYVLDANIFIEAAQRYYAFDLVPKFWAELVEKAGLGKLCSIDRIKEELLKGNDSLAQWVSHDFIDAFKKSDDQSTLEDWRLTASNNAFGKRLSITFYYTFVYTESIVLPAAPGMGIFKDVQ